MFLLRFDMRSPGGDPAATAELYSTALDMARWADKRSCLALVLSEHHASPDGYLPAPIVLAAGMAACTDNVPIQISALLAPLYDPVRLAEEISVLDHLSNGRLSYVIGMGYRKEEYAMFGRPMAGRGRHMDACLTALRQAWSGESFEFEGRAARVTPVPLTPGGPPLLMGGNSRAAVRRAVRFDMGLMAQGGIPELEQAYQEECERAGATPQTCLVPPEGSVTVAFFSHDPDAAWKEIGPYMLHDAQSYAAWAEGLPIAASISTARTVDELRQENGPYRIFTPDQACQYVAEQAVLVLHPLCGGLPPEIAWRSLEVLDRDILPRIAAR